MADKRQVRIFDTDAFDRDFNSGLRGAYLFFGEEDYLKSNRLQKIRKSILTAEGFELFNHVVLTFTSDYETSREEQFQKLADSMEAVPMMQDKVLVEVHDLCLDKLKNDELETVANACRKADETVILVIYCRTDELSCEYRFEESKMFKTLSEAAKAVRFNLLPKGQLVGYCKKYLAKEFILISNEAAELLCNMCSYRLYPLIGEMSKLAAYCANPDKEPVNVDESIVRRVCSETADDEQPFALTEAMQKWMISGILDAVAMSKDQREEPIMFVSKMARIFTDMLTIKAGMGSGLSTAEIAGKLHMNANRVARYVESLSRVPVSVIENAVKEVYELDLSLKSTMADPWTMIDCFISRIYMPKSLKEAGNA